MSVKKTKKWRFLEIDGFEKCMQYLRQYGTTISELYLNAYKVDDNELAVLFELFHSLCWRKAHTICLTFVRKINITSWLQPFLELWVVKLIYCNIPVIFQHFGYCFRSLTFLKIEGTIGEESWNFNFPNMETLKFKLRKFDKAEQYVVLNFLIRNRASLRKVAIGRIYPSDPGDFRIDDDVVIGICETLEGSVDLSGFNSNEEVAEIYFNLPSCSLETLKIKTLSGPIMEF